MKSQFQLYVIAAILMTIGVGVVIYKHRKLGFPLLPNEKEEVWVVEAKITFEPTGGPVKVTFSVPGETGRINILDESYASAGYGFLRDDDLPGDGVERRVVWSRREAKGVQKLYYRVIAHRSFTAGAQRVIPDFSEIRPPEYDELEEEAAKAIVERAKERSSDRTTFAAEILRDFNQKEPSQEANILLGREATPEKKADVLADLFSYTAIRTYIVYGIPLTKSARSVKLVPYIVFEDGGRYVIFSPTRHQPGVEEDILFWQRGGRELLQVSGGKNARATFSVIRDSRPTLGLSQESAAKKKVALIDFSIYTLPIEQENAFIVLLMVPLGALIVVIIRSVVGISTSGTFMPILLALAFAGTRLVPGLIMFAVVIGLGLVVRTYLSKLDLLLVPRISAVVVIVITIMAAVSILSHKLGIEQGLRVAIFPVIILSWTVERLCILWEEDGGKEVFRQLGGSLLVASIIYGLFVSRHVRHWLFCFPELVLVILGIILMLGQYTGYRLSELIRFAPLAKSSSDDQKT